MGTPSLSFSGLPYTTAQSIIPSPANKESPTPANPAAAAPELDKLAADTVALPVLALAIIDDDTAEVTPLADEVLVPVTVNGTVVVLLPDTTVAVDKEVDKSELEADPLVLVLVLVTVTPDGLFDDRMEEMIDATEESVDVMMV